LLGLIIFSFLLALLTGFWGVNAEETSQALPALQVHPLPPTLTRWQAPPQTGDYFSAIKSTPVGYLVWSTFPIKVYLDRPPSDDEASASNRRFRQWVVAVRQAIQEWTPYLPLTEVEDATQADIIIRRSPPPLGTAVNPETGKVEIARARSAQTRYEFYLSSAHPPVLSHRMTIQISPGLSDLSILSATRHELGHALGIWGHSQLETDALYFSQVRNPPPISARDINTLKKIYQQPTRLGWALN
jgi:predicted Zn-dependent protease